ncbi:MAG: hypothetical protein ACRDA3_11125 [Peptostreptococcaceae bacterium]
MKKLRFMLVVTLCAFIALCTNIMISHSNDFTSNHITLENDVEMTKEKLHPVIVVKNNTSKDLLVTYDFYVTNKDGDVYNNDILVKANDSYILEIPQLHHLGDSHESRTIWFNWSEPGRSKPLQNEIETTIFYNPVVEELGLN